MINIDLLSKDIPLNIIIGASNTSLPGWISTQETELNLLNKNEWELSFRNRKIDRILAEHVWEHMSKEDGIKAAKICFEFLKPGGYIRCAVPDANFKNEFYQNIAKIGGPGQKDHPASTHKILYDYKALKNVFENVGFEIEILEYCDENGIFHYKYWNPDDGKINRSLKYDVRNAKDLQMVSIIIDAKKPLIIDYLKK
jgi:predicted SAM-dependent methyltransferase